MLCPLTGAQWNPPGGCATALGAIASATNGNVVTTHVLCIIDQ